jgi:nitrile hydratase subunit beta
MNGIHDMGGMDGFGRVEPEADEPPFHAAWEGRALALNRVVPVTGDWNIDVGRYWIETLPPAVYLTSSYYRKWQLRLERLCVARGLVTEEELATGHAAAPAQPGKKVVPAAEVDGLLARKDYARPPPAPARFDVGAHVRTRNMHPVSHTRLPRFARGHTGTIERIQGCHVYPDASVAEGVERPEWLYTVTFDGRELWGPDADPTVRVSIEAFEPYLEAA